MGLVWGRNLKKIANFEKIISIIIILNLKVNYDSDKFKQILRKISRNFKLSRFWIGNFEKFLKNLKKKWGSIKKGSKKYWVNFN